jgi:hypothetical protein
MADQQERAEQICKCGHDGASHYSVRAGTVRNPCHHMGKHDMRCGCRDFKPVPGKVAEVPAVSSEVERRLAACVKADKAVERANAIVRGALDTLTNASAQQALAYDSEELAELFAAAKAETEAHS